MRRRSRIAIGILLAVGLAATIAACDRGPQEPQRAQGIVEEVDRADRKLTIDHDEIPGMMKAMTMTFDVAPGVPLDDVEAGEQIDFQVKMENGSYTVTEIRRPGE